MRRFIAQVLVILNEIDPYDLHPGQSGGAPPNEYDLEAENIARHLVQNGSISIDQVNDIWNKWFDEPLTRVIDEHDIRKFITTLNRLSNAR